MRERGSHTCPPIKVALGVEIERRALQPNVYNHDVNDATPSDYWVNQH